MPPSTTFRTLPHRVEQGRHLAFRQEIQGEYEFSRPTRPPRTRQGYFDAYNEATAAMQTMIDTAVQQNTTLRARGSLWSLNKVCVADGHLIDNKSLRLVFPMPKRELSATYTGDDPQKQERLWFVECGTSVSALNNVLFRYGQTIKATGSNNGQTITGAVSTNTHGSAFRFGATQDFVVGLHLIVGPSRHVYLERESHPVVVQRFVQRLGPDTELIRDDQLFNAALVSFGSMGIIHGLMIEAAPLRLLHVVRFAHPYNRVLKDAIASLDPSTLPLPANASHVPTGSPYHFEIVFNPNAGTPPDEGYILLLYEDDWDPQTYEPPQWDHDQAGPGASGLEAMGFLIEILPDIITKPILNDEIAERFKNEVDEAVIKDLFRGERVQGKAMAAGMGIPLDRAVEALDLVFATYESFGTVLPVLFDMRFVKGTKALLGFTRFDPTCILEIDAINTTNSRRFLKEVWKQFDRAQIPFTLHWGKLNAHLTRNRVKTMYGPARDEWIAARERLLSSPSIRAVFSNEFIEGVGLTEPAGNT